MRQTWINEAFKDELPESFHGGVKWQSPSNIALVKYWGKKGVQLPQNPSVSFTLSQCRTETSVFYEKSDRFGLSFYFDGKANPAFQSKIEAFLLDQADCFPFLNQLDLRIHSHNTFPHSSGIASSASSMSALALCLLDLERMAKGERAIDMRKASYFARLASGSACRSLFPKMALWGATPVMPGSTDDYAISLEDDIAPVFKSYHDSVLVVSDEAKTVSSRTGHGLMTDNPYAETRYQQAFLHVEYMLTALKTGDINTFIQVTEAEALQLHALMMCSNPSFILLNPSTLKIIQAVRAFRAETDIPICFTLDAGPNVHVLYPDRHAEIVERFIMDELERYCMGGLWIADRVGDGPSSNH